jgi:hypothetical protein
VRFFFFSPLLFFFSLLVKKIPFFSGFSYSHLISACFASSFVSGQLFPHQIVLFYFFFKEEEKELEERNLAVQSLLSDGMNITTARPGEPCFVFCFVCFIKVLDRPRAPARNI